MTLTVRSVDVGGASVRVRVNGTPVGLPFVYWHGLGHAGNGAFLDVAAPGLVRAGVTTYALDAPGFGGSSMLEPDGFEVDHLAVLLWDLVETLELKRPLVLSGHSWGGVIVVAAAAARPEDVAALVLLDSGHMDYAEQPDANPDATIEELIAELEADPVPDTWDELVVLLAEHDLDRPWTLDAWREGFEVDSDGRITRLTSDLALAAARLGLMRGRPSDAWPAIAAAGIPALLLLATEPPEQRQANADAAELMRTSVPQADVRAIAGMRHAVFPDLGAGAGTLMADWLREQRIAGLA